MDNHRGGYHMSEFSESYHLQTSNIQDGIDLLKRASLKGFVYPASNNWVTLLPEGSSFQPNNKLIQANQGLLLHYINAEDHGWAFNIYEGIIQTSHYECTWEEDITIDQQDLNPEKVQSIISSNQQLQQPITTIELIDLLTPEDLEQLFETTPAEQFAQLVGLENYEWVSYDYVQSEHDPEKFNDNGIVFI
jgi:hypothetical protein